MPTTVFISYAHSPENRAIVRRIADTLRQRGVEALIDQYVEPQPDEGWPRWMERSLQSADFIVCVCTEAWRERVEGREDPNRGRGVDWESTFIYNKLYESKSNLRQFIPAILSEDGHQYIPTALKGATAYTLPQRFTDMYAHITGQNRPHVPEVGDVQAVAPASPVVLGDEWDLGGSVPTGGVATPPPRPAVLTPAPAPSATEVQEALFALFKTVFSPGELRREVMFLPTGSALVGELPSEYLPFNQQALSIAGLLVRKTALSEAWFRDKAHEIPGRASEFREVGAKWAAFVR